MDDLLTAGGMRLSPSGAHLTSTDTDLGELFWVSSMTGRSPIRGGVPVIAPAFADLLAGAPRHGWARTADWRVTTDGRVFDAEVVNEGIHLLLHVRELADGVRLDLTARNESREDRTVQLGFHPYFRVADVARVHVEGLDGVEVLDRLSGEWRPQSGEVRVQGEFDRIFLASHQVRIVDEQRVITVEAEGADATVVWNPGEKAAAGMQDVGGGEWADFLCVEPALLGADLSGVVLAPSQERRLTMTVRVSPSGS